MVPRRVITGAGTAWDHELDEWRNADIMATPGRGPLQQPFALAQKVAAAVIAPRSALAWRSNHCLYLA